MTLDRFLSAQQGTYPQALEELRAGRKRSHWMWFIFPQIAGLGQSDMARFYAIADQAEATAYLAHPTLGQRLRTCATALLDHTGTPAETILGGIDAMKLRSSMTLFDAVAGEDRVAPFALVLEQFYAGARDPATLARL